ncbi:MAG: peptide ABC transporter permease [Candidatus Muiribacterium halophilum]|uniref:Peptide ABC transporter permease n=1 Tax=Muiribacterium halophilum TaxID=2053465 RepID=A0A2N5ZBB6_MUIH1|nr:MAG: peptide ABC transporter permease [Candidatus Muirbacterium halophilum]
MKKTWMLLLSGFFILVMLTGFFIPDKLYNSISITDRFKAPSERSLFGTDPYGRDLFYRTAKATSNTILFSLIAVSISVVVGFFFGLLSGYVGGFFDFLIQTIIDVMMSFPSFFLVLTIIVTMPQNGWNVVVAIVLSSWPNIARLIRAEVITLKNREFIVASKSIGASPLRIIVFHLIPNCLNTLIVITVLSFGTAILVESSLSFLSLGFKDDIPTLGNLIALGRDVLRSWWISFFPGVFLFLVIFTVNLSGEYLKDKLDPRL